MGTKLTARLALLAMVVVGIGAQVSAKDVDIEPMFGGVLIDGYNFGADGHPAGTIRYDAKANEFRGHYSGLRMPPGRRAIFAWLHDTVNQKSTYLGVVGWLKVGTVGANEADFTLKLPAQYKGGKFATSEIVGFTAERTDLIAENGVVAAPPTRPSGSDLQAAFKPAFYLYAKLPGAKTDRAYCGHGKDFFYARAPDKQTCYDCICGQKYVACRAAGLAAH